MNLELDHVFILVEPGAMVADLLVSLGMLEGKRNKHKGQGTSNRRFYFSNGMLEFLWIHDQEEANNGPGKALRFPERTKDPAASPFGVILHRKDNSNLKMPFKGWQYQPEYFDPPWAFHVGENSRNLIDPLCIYVPFVEPQLRKIEEGTFKSISRVGITTTSKPLSDVLSVANTTDRLLIETGTQHLMDITFDNHRSGNSKDFRPAIPLVIHW